MQLTIKGDIKKLNQLVRELKNKCRRDKLEMSLTGNKVQEAEKPSVLTAKDTAKLIVECKKIEDLKKFKPDKRQLVKLAYDKKLKEFK